ncbi:hypothetical protein QJQ45_011129 [Haematococcus lacustris]|nr:hypothetical protein QJQ45_011129 [Haematococcus lacustris]
MAKKKNPGKKQKASRSPQGKQRQERRNGWDTKKRKVIKVLGGAVLRGCKKTKRNLMAHLQLRAEVHSQLRVIASLFVLRIFLTCLVEAPCSSQEATLAAASEPEPSTPPPAKRSKRTEAEQAAEPTQPTKGKGKGEAAKAKPAPQPGRWLDRDCNSVLNIQRIEESRWRPLELCWWP